MRDLAAVDRQLAELVAEHEVSDVKALLGRILGSDRSLARLNEELDAYGPMARAASARPAAPLRDPLAAPAQRLSMRAPAPNAEPRPGARTDAPPAMRPNPPGVRGSLPPRIVSPLAPVQGDSLKTATPWPPVSSSLPAPARSPRDTLVDAAVPPPALPQVDEVELDAETAALFGITAPPAARGPGSSPAAAPVEIPAAAAVPAPTPTPIPILVPEHAEDSERPSSRTPRPTLQGWAAGLEPLAPPVFTPAPPHLPTAEALHDGRPSTRELLEREIDPNDFPSAHPPRAASIPPPLRKQPAGQAQDGFEMLIDDEADEDIIEIEDVELEEIE
ncbi:MAG TPA: hypothetical protein VK509_17455 [Polyangiales bacterium]|nr:hypothetical protein [Polyangiales bacterium]